MLLIKIVFIKIKTSMKNLMLTLLFVSAFTFITVAQERQDDGSFKPTSGFTTEVNFIPANTAAPISMNFLKLRMFMSESMALRLGFDLGMHSEKSTKLSTVTTDPNEETKNSYFIFGLNPGIEMHMGDMPKLSPYVGAELGISMKTSKTTVTNAGNVNNNTIETTNCWADGSNPGYFELSLNFILGTDYYFSKHLFMGAEMGLGFANTSFKEQKQTATSGGVSITVTNPKSSSMNFGINYNPAIRLGWAF